MVAVRADSADLDIRAVRDRLGVSRELMGHLLGVSAKTIDRWEAKASLPLGDSVRLTRLTAMNEAALLGHAVYTKAGFSRFLRLPLAEFNGASALELIARGDTEPVIAALAADYEGLGY